MSYFKTLKKSDVQTTPYPTNKLWSATLASYGALGIKLYIGENLSGSEFQSASSPRTTDSASGDTQFRGLVYESIKQLYYKNYLSASYLNISTSYDNFEQNTIYSSISSSYLEYYNSTIKEFPTASNSIIRVISIPKNIFGSKIVPGTFQLTGSDYNIIDDREGNLFDRFGNPILVGNIVYPHGLAIITNPSYSLVLPTSSLETITYVSGSVSGSFFMSFKGEHTVYENEVRCNINEDEFNYTLNPSSTSDFSGSLYGFVTGSDFNPYVTTVGLYNEASELLAVGKLAKPIFIPRNNSITFVLKWDS